MHENAVDVDASFPFKVRLSMTRTQLHISADMYAFQFVYHNISFQLTFLTHIYN